jgi:YegS/Rv2252/BmrU family lipid kinase
MNPNTKSSLVIYNPIAGTGRTLKFLPDIQSGLQEASIDFDVAATGAPLDAEKLAQNAQTQYSSVIGIGGDGTIHEIVNGLMRASGENETIPLGVIPLGNGDDFSKMIPPETSIGGRPFDWRTAITKISAGQTRLFDVGRILANNSAANPRNYLHYFANSFDVGFGAQGAENMLRIPNYFKGFSGYLASLVVTLFNYPTLNLQIQLDDQEPFTQTTTMTAVMNGRCFGNGFWICPQAEADDGYLDLLVCKAIGRLTITRLVPKLMRGTHVGDPVLSFYRARRVVIDSQVPIVIETDGELPLPKTDHLEIEILHKRLQIFV